MYYRKLGSTGHLAGEIGLDARTLAAVPSDDEAVALVRYAITRGAGFIDTAGDARGDGIVARALDGMREEALIAASAGWVSGDGPASPNFSPEQIALMARASIQRLRCGYLDLFQLDRPTVEALRDEKLWQALGALKDEGVIRHIGVIASDLDVAFAALEDGRVATLQIVLNALDHSLLPLLAVARARGVGVIVRDPLVADLVDDELELPGGHRDDSPVGSAVAQRRRLVRLLYADGGTAALASLGWVLAHVTVSVAIIGAGSMEQLEQILATSGRPLPSTRQMLAIQHAQLTAAVS